MNVGGNMGAFDRFFIKENLIRKTIEIDNNLYEELKKISENKYDASVNKLINASIEELIIIFNLYCIPIIQNDTNNYYSQIILPICHSDKLDGILIFYRKDRNYIPSSAKSAITTKEFTEKLSDINFQ